jgi:hypothetical protein
LCGLVSFPFERILLQWRYVFVVLWRDLLKPLLPSRFWELFVGYLQTFLGFTLVNHVARDAYWSRNLGVDLGEVDEGLVEVLDGLGGVFGRLVSDIAYAPMGEEFDVGYGILGKVLAHIVLGESRWQSAHEYARRLRCCTCLHGVV